MWKSAFCRGVFVISATRQFRRCSSGECAPAGDSHVHRAHREPGGPKTEEGKEHPNHCRSHRRGLHHALCPRRLEGLASSLEAEHPGAAGSIREGLDETLTLQRLGIEGALYRTLRSTNTIENLNGGVATYTRNVKRWQGGSMVVRWVSAGILEAEKKFRRVQGYRDIAKLMKALETFEAEDDAAARRVA